MSDKEQNTPNHKDIVQCLIGEGVALQGDITITGGLHIDGKVTGNITMGDGNAARLTLSSNGVIKGNVRVNDADINGQVRGDVHARGHVTLYPNARIEGDVSYESLEIKRGAQLNGNLNALHDKSARPATRLFGKMKRAGQ
ncbi:MAG: polymer-forming cytoskeletal protein [Granulosicoccaceae bacterium]|jgi:cytoskeletal protein CcmA (bactofilin family)